MDTKLCVVGQSLVKRDIRDGIDPGFEEVVEIIRTADLAFTNFEATIAGPFGGWPTKTTHVGTAPPGAMDALRECGFNMLALSNNHAFDLGVGGILSTLERARQCGFLHAGTGEDLTNASAPTVHRIGNRNAALVAFDAGPMPDYTYAKDATDRLPARPGVNRQKFRQEILASPPQMELLSRVKAELAHEEEWNKAYVADEAHPGRGVLEFHGLQFRLGDGSGLHCTPDPEDLSRNMSAISEASERADIALAYMHHHFHSGRLQEVPEWVRSFARQCIDAGADIFVSHGVPMIQGIEIYRGKPIFYSLGNFIFQSWAPERWQDRRSWRSVVCVNTFDERRSTKQIACHPIVISDSDTGDGSPISRRGMPSLAHGDQAREILQELVSCCSDLGTAVELQGEVAIIRPIAMRGLS